MLSHPQQSFVGPSYPFYAGTYLASQNSADIPLTDTYGEHNLADAASHDALYYQASNWELEHELYDNYLASGIQDPPPPSHQAPFNTCDTSIAMLVPDVFDMTLCVVAVNDAFEAASYLNCQAPGSDAYYDVNLNASVQYGSQYSPEIFVQPPGPAEVSCISPTLIDSPAAALPAETRRRSPRVAQTSPYPSASPEPQQPELLKFKRRNVQVPSSTSTMHNLTTRTNRWKCPYCPYVQQNRRTPDMKRHIATHTRSADGALWVCCGVPLADAHALGVPEDVACKEPFEFDGEYMVGGCKKTFSRRDALTRHLRREEGRCFGDAFSFHQPGNKGAVGAN